MNKVLFTIEVTDHIESFFHYFTNWDTFGIKKNLESILRN